jgi:5-methylcytosine-specific restriction enzyme subunit McrC
VVIPIENIYYLLCYAWNKLEEQEIVQIDPTQSTTLQDLFSSILASGLEFLFKRGIDRSYVVHNEESSIIRGRLNLTLSIRKNLFIQARAHCEYDELSYDVLHNQILKATISRLLAAGDVVERNRNRLHKLGRRLSSVSSIELTKRIFGQVQLHSNNHIYDFLLRVCELIFENLLPTTERGGWKFRSFLQDERQMRSLYEEFVRNFYIREAPLAFPDEKLIIKREDINWRFLPIDAASKLVLPKMQTDVCIIRSSKKIAIECKFTARSLRPGRFGGPPKLIEGHLYQLNSYLENLDASAVNATCRAILLYPKTTSDLRYDYLKSNGQAIAVRTLDLNRPWHEIHNDLLAMIA